MAHGCRPCAAGLLIMGALAFNPIEKGRRDGSETVHRGAIPEAHMVHSKQHRSVGHAAFHAPRRDTALARFKIDFGPYCCAQLRCSNEGRNHQTKGQSGLHTVIVGQSAQELWKVFTRRRLMVLLPPGHLQRTFQATWAACRSNSAPPTWCPVLKVLRGERGCSAIDDRRLIARSGFPSRARAGTPSKAGSPAPAAPHGPNDRLLPPYGLL
jgi:hypothetical protein